MKYSTADARAAFLAFFRKGGHEVLPSSALVPKDDPSLMFVAAGMVPFKNIFTGVQKTEMKRAASSQKCVRAGGKHNDLDNVGYTARHHTFFEMLGNFSFGDYFKEGAIAFAWELLTKDYGIDPGKLTFTVYHTDDEAYNLWKKITGCDERRILRVPTKDNFWAMGDTGPCGPCSEIFYDHGAQAGEGEWALNADGSDRFGSRFVEIWNLVFMQFDQQPGGEQVPLPKPSIDTGMGLERISAVLQGVYDNYDIDLFQNLIRAIEEVSGFRIQDSGSKQATLNPESRIPTPAPYKVIADHLRSCGFLIADGVTPSNEGRGYVLRRIMRRGMRYAHQLGCKEPLMHRLVPALVKEMGGAYPELTRAEANITETLRGEEERFKQTLERGLKLLDDESARLAKGQTLPGDVAFKLYDTYGFPLDLTQDILRGRGMSVDTEGFERSMEGQREMARAAWSGSGEQTVGKLWFDLKEKLGATQFTGYEETDTEARVLALVKQGAEVKRAEAGDEVFVILDRTPFYGESGGQVGDTGWLKKEGIPTAEVLDTQKPIEEFHAHKARLVKALSVGDAVEASIDSERRARIRANHSATHLMHKALRDRLGDHVTQKGSLVGPDYLRFDFSHGKAMTAEEIADVERDVNAMIWNNTPVSTKHMAPDDAIKAGAMALFGEKYGAKVRVLSMGESTGPYSVELCGGTHVAATGDIGLFKIISEGAVAAGIRRVEAVTRDGAFAYLAAQDARVRTLAERLKSPADAVEERIGKLQDENKKLAKELAEAKKQLALGGGASATVNKEMIGDIGFAARIFDDLAPKELRGVAEDLLKTAEPGVAVAATGFEGKGSVVVAVSGALAAKHSAVALVQVAVAELGGKGGGGRPEMAQGGGPEAARLQAAIEAIKDQLAK